MAAQLEAAAIRAVLARRDDLPANCFLSLNVSASSLLSSEVQSALAEAGTLQGLVVELTEHEEVADYERLRRSIGGLRALGAMLAVDDVGAGHSSLRHITLLRPSFVKIDRHFIGGLDRDEVNMALVEMIGAFAARMDAWIVAEGVERPPELEALMRLGVPLAQGYLLGHPAPGWTDLGPEVSAYIRTRTTTRDLRDSVGGLVEGVVAVPAADAERAASRIFAADPWLTVIPVLDRWSRPVGLLCRDALEDGKGWKLSIQRVKATSEAREAIRRAMARDRRDRFDPLVCCDSQGRYVGLVPVERLVERLAR